MTNHAILEPLIRRKVFANEQAEDAWLDWKAAQEMLNSWLSINQYCKFGAKEMMMSETMDVTILDVPQESMVALRVSRDEFARDLRMAAAMKYYEMGRLSSGSAARLAGVPRVVFLTRLADYNIDTFRLTEEELERETRLA